MSVRRFNADIRSAAAKVQQGEIPGVTAISKGDSDGEVVITFRHDNLPQPIRVRALAQEASEYPDGNNFMLFTDNDDLPPQLMKAMERSQEYLLGNSVVEMVAIVAKFLGSADQDNSVDEDEDEEMTDCDDTISLDEGYDSDDNDFMGHDDEHFGLLSSADEYQQRLPAGNAHAIVSGYDQLLFQRIKSDLRITKEAGYRVGVYNGLGTSALNGLVSISIRVSKLDLSEAALNAWDVPETDYIVLLIKYDMRYYPVEKIAGLPVAHSGVQLRIGLCNTYKPTGPEAVAAFCDLDPAQTDPGIQGTTDGAFRPMFISVSLNQFMNESLLSLVKLRMSEKASWDGANDFLLHLGSLGKGRLNSTLPFQNNAESAATTQEEPNHILRSDHLLEDCQAHSFPLLAMQFAMRHFARCTQFCLRCHKRVEEGFEALRPYVCSNPLCLFQYMSMGLGPNVEHEILTEPSVVDLLVSLCYASLQAVTFYRFAITQPLPSGQQPSLRPENVTSFPIRDFPVGLRLRVPNLFPPKEGDMESGEARPQPFTVELDRNNTALGLCLVCPRDADLNRLVTSQWIFLRYHPVGGIPADQKFLIDRHNLVSGTANARITAVLPDQGRVEIELLQHDPNLRRPACFPQWAQQADVYPYDVEFDTLDDGEKSIAMQHVLNTLPPIDQIREHLSRHPNITLRTCEDVSPAAGSLLRWIVSSNRSCINEIGTIDHDLIIAPDGQEQRGAPYWTIKEKRKKEYIAGMNGYIQFRFSQGSPDKELRFNKALQEVAQLKDLSQFPTIFAWHGSDVGNWHSILRTGLDFKDVKIGRAYGDGVYFSPNFNTSTGYASASRPSQWPNSKLKVNSVMSLNEIINSPEQFVSRTPHYVVGQQDWHQCRYLFVSSSTGQLAQISTQAVGNDISVAMLPQALGNEVKGPSNLALQIPMASMPARTATAAQYGTLTTGGNSLPCSNEDNDDDSDESSTEDQELLAIDRARLSRSSSVETVLARDMLVTHPLFRKSDSN